MKMTLHIDDGLLARVMAVTGATSKTKAIDLALRELDRKAKLMKLSSEGLGLAPDELKDAVDPAYDLEALRRHESPAGYGRKSHSR
jgi:Arc/MetJ family transcription regulator